MVSREDVPLPTGRRNGLAVVLALAAILALVPALLSVHNLRLMADDYVFAARALDLGVIGAAQDWYQVQFGGVTFNYLGSAFAWAIGALPWGWGYLPYVLALLIVIFVGCTLALRVAAATLAVRFALLGGLVALPLWVLGIGSVGPAHDILVLLGQFNWMSAGYRALAVWGFIIAVLVGFAATRWAIAWRVVAGLVIGLVVGMSLLPETLAFISTLIVLMALYWWRGSGRHDALWSLTYASSLLVGLVVSLPILWFSPGALARKDSFIPVPVGEVPGRWLPEVLDYLREVANPSMLLVFVGGAALGLLLRAVLPSSDLPNIAPRAMRLAVGVGLLLVLLVVFGALGSVLSYSAVWHKWGAVQAMFLLMLLLGLALGARLARHRGDGRTLVVAYVALVLVMLAALVPGTLILRLSAERAELWDSGAPAPLDYIADREAEANLQAWLTIQAHRD